MYIRWPFQLPHEVELMIVAFLYLLFHYGRYSMGVYPGEYVN